MTCTDRAAESQAAASPFLPVARPRLPSAERLLPYLQEIDRNRTYSNQGPLARRLESRLAARLGLPDGAVAAVANATLGLAVAAAIVRRPEGRLCLMPSWTFAASGHAARSAGLEPFFVDVDEDDWSMSPDAARAALAQAPGPVGCAMPVAPFGQPADAAAWAQFQADTGVPVVIDAAASFDALQGPYDAPMVVSLHATKALGAGEGGFVVRPDPEFIQMTQQRCNFGFFGSREAVCDATNAKMSEYHAAAALAALDAWPETRDMWRLIARSYLDARRDAPGLAFPPGYGETWVASTCVARLPEGTAARVAAGLAQAGIESRAWWGAGLHAHAAFANCPRTPLPVTSKLAASSLGLPCFPELTAQDVQFVARTIAEALKAA